MHLACNGQREARDTEGSTKGYMTGGKDETLYIEKKIEGYEEHRLQECGECGLHD